MRTRVTGSCVLRPSCQRMAEDVGLGLNGVDMTANRARKHAARELAASKDARYVVARRELDETEHLAHGSEPERPYPCVVRLLHDLTHRFPGVPKHRDPSAIRAEHDARHAARAATVRARHEAARIRHHGQGSA